MQRRSGVSSPRRAHTARSVRMSARPRRTRRARSTRGCAALDEARHAARASASSIRPSAPRRGPLRRIVGARAVADGAVCGAQQIMLRRQPKTVDRAVRAPRIATTGILAMLK
ncbi:hypothetical protein C6P92_19980 [Burkholderia multivorans]|nr:hypothetical protein HMPREF3115_07845 [Burkholderia sp. HMSC10F09]PRE12449.1 hypothetical protein C6P92_19980 [Burkholderia multivorans]PRG33530.1 hypothetical protein C6T62_19145 [Burkholderia multivorans]RSB78706.1 hypothetical protein EGT33_01205 [Burkholderia multivorans]